MATCRCQPDFEELRITMPPHHRALVAGLWFYPAVVRTHRRMENSFVRLIFSLTELTHDLMLEDYESCFEYVCAVKNTL